MTYAKSLANGYPLAAIGGSAEVMGTIEPGRLAHGGTYCGNAVGASAARATLDVLAQTDALEQIRARGARLMQGLDEVFTEAGLEHELTGLPAMFGINLQPQVRPVRNYRDTCRTNEGLFEALASAMRQRGVEVEPDWREPLFLCAALTSTDVEETLNIVNDSIKDVKQ
jgi:glutamate-1-semialdehyde 2,1-aminomutase